MRIFSIIAPPNFSFTFLAPHSSLPAAAFPGGFLPAQQYLRFDFLRTKEIAIKVDYSRKSQLLQEQEGNLPFKLAVILSELTMRYQCARI